MDKKGTTERRVVQTMRMRQNVMNLGKKNLIEGKA
jgi:hypothetical protein